MSLSRLRTGTAHFCCLGCMYVFQILHNNPEGHPRRLQKYRAVQSLCFSGPHSIGRGRGQRCSVISVRFPPTGRSRSAPSRLSRPADRRDPGIGSGTGPGRRPHRRPDRGRTHAGAFHPHRRHVVCRLFVAHRASSAQNGRCVERRHLLFFGHSPHQVHAPSGPARRLSWRASPAWATGLVRSNPRPIRAKAGTLSSGWGFPRSSV